MVKVGLVGWILLTGEEKGEWGESLGVGDEG